jgi:RND family efflux transporter MFP subunit
MPSQSQISLAAWLRMLPLSVATIVAAGATSAATGGDLPPTVVVGAGTGGASLMAPGQLRAVSQAELGAQAAGRVTAVLVRSGESVRRGQVLLRIDSPGARAAAEAGDAQAAAAAAQQASARADFARAQRLHEQKYLSDAALERAQAQLKTIEAQSTASAAQARAARETAGWEELRAPYDGRVTSVSVAVGDLAAPGRPLIGVYAPGPMRVQAEIPEAAAGELAADQPARIEFAPGACPGAPTLVKSWTLVPAIDARSRAMEVRVELPDLQACPPGSLVRLGLPLRSARHLLAIPQSAVVHRGELDAVYAVDGEGRVGLRQVRLGEAVGDTVEVLAGLESGERILRDAAQYRAPGAGKGSVP